MNAVLTADLLLARTAFTGFAVCDSQRLGIVIKVRTTILSELERIMGGNSGMTDNELEYRTVSQCISSDYARGWNDATMQAEKLIVIKNAEIERLNKEVDRLSQCVLYHDGQISDAIKEFWSRIQGVAYQSEREWSHGEHPMLVELDDIKEIYEEMVGDGDA